jgi:hypothetical protein
VSERNPLYRNALREPTRKGSPVSRYLAGATPPRRNRYESRAGLPAEKRVEQSTGVALPWAPGELLDARRVVETVGEDQAGPEHSQQEEDEDERRRHGWGRGSARPRNGFGEFRDYFFLSRSPGLRLPLEWKCTLRIGPVASHFAGAGHGTGSSFIRCRGEHYRSN